MLCVEKHFFFISYIYIYIYCHKQWTLSFLSFSSLPPKTNNKTTLFTKNPNYCQTSNPNPTTSNFPKNLKISTKMWIRIRWPLSTTSFQSKQIQTLTSTNLSRLGTAISKKLTMSVQSVPVINFYLLRIVAHFCVAWNKLFKCKINKFLSKFF